MTLREFFENYDELNEDIDGKLKSIAKKVRNVALASLIGLSLLGAGCTAKQKEAIYNTYNDTKSKIERHIEDGAESISEFGDTITNGISNTIKKADIPGKIEKGKEAVVDAAIGAGEVVEKADQASADWIYKKYENKFNKEMEKLTPFQQGVIKAKLVAYAGKLGLTEADSFETKKAIMFMKYWKKLIEKAKKEK